MNGKANSPILSPSLTTYMSSCAGSGGNNPRCEQNGYADDDEEDYDNDDEADAR